MTLTEAARAGIERVRLPHWANPGDYIKIDILDGEHLGPWAHLYAPCQDLFPDMPRPQDYFSFQDKDDRYEPYDGPLLETTS